MAAGTFTNESFADRVLVALECGDWLTWSELCLATDLTLFWVRESLNDLVECGMVEVQGEQVFKFRSVAAAAVKAARTNQFFNARHDARVAAGNRSLEGREPSCDACLGQ